MESTHNDKEGSQTMPQNALLQEISSSSDARNAVLAAFRPAHLIRLFFGLGQPPTSNWFLIGFYHLITVAIVGFLFTSVGFLITYLNQTGLAVNTQSVLGLLIIAHHIQGLISIVVGLRFEYRGRYHIVAAWEHARADNWFCLGCSRKLKAVTWLCICLLAVYVSGIVAFIVGMTAANVDGIEDFNNFFFFGQINLLYPFLYILLVVPWGVTQASYATLVYAVKYAFMGFRKRIAESTDVGADLHKWSFTYSRLLDLLFEVDRQLNFYAGAMVATVLPCIIGILFQFAGGRGHEAGTANKVAAAFLGFGMLFLLCVICSGSACNTELGQVYKAFSRRFGDPELRLNQEQREEAAILLQRMIAAKEFGITAGQFFVIREGTIITFASIIITYLVMLIKFEG